MDWLRQAPIGEQRGQASFEERVGQSPAAPRVGQNSVERTHARRSGAPHLGQDLFDPWERRSPKQCAVECLLDLSVRADGPKMGQRECAVGAPDSVDLHHVGSCDLLPAMTDRTGHASIALPRHRHFHDHRTKAIEPMQRRRGSVGSNAAGKRTHHERSPPRWIGAAESEDVGQRALQFAIVDARRSRGLLSCRSAAWRRLNAPY